MEEKQSNPWKTFLSTAGLGVVAVFVAIYSYMDLVDWEKTGGTRMMNSVVAFAYRTLGKNGVLGVGLAAGAVLVAIGTWDLVKQLKKRKQTPADSPTDIKAP